MAYVGGGFHGAGLHSVLEKYDASLTEATKWADELLMRDLVAHCGVPVSVFRPTMILPPRSFAGEINADDLLTRLLQSIVVDVRGNSRSFGLHGCHNNVALRGCDGSCVGQRLELWRGRRLILVDGGRTPRSPS